MTIRWFLSCLAAAVIAESADGFVLQSSFGTRSLSLELDVVSVRYAGDVRPGKQTPQRVVVDESILKPDYADDGVPKRRDQGFPQMIEVKSQQEILKMRDAGRVAREVLDAAGRAVEVGVTTDEIDAIVHQQCLDRGAYPSPLNYHGFPKSCCTSVNEVICHGIPDDRKLRDGDIINIDVTCYLDGYHGDCSEMFLVGQVDENAQKLIQTTYNCWVEAMDFVRPGKHYREIGGIIEDHVMQHGYTTVRNFVGHGIGSIFHCKPNVLHYRNDQMNGRMAPGHTFTIEPMICEGSAQALKWPDGWTATTIDGKRSAQFEHTLLVTSEGVEALTGKTETSPLQPWEMSGGFWLGSTAEARKRAEELTKAAKGA